VIKPCSIRFSTEFLQFSDTTYQEHQVDPE